jgi:hypothetical protein
MSESPMRGHFRYLRFKTFPMTPRTPQCEVLCPLLSSSEHSGVPEDSQPPTFPSVGLHPHTWPKWGCDIKTNQRDACTHIYHNAQGRLRWNSHVYWNKLQRSSEGVCRWWPCNNHREHLENPSELWRQLSYKGILEKLKDKGRAWPFYIATKS